MPPLNPLLPGPLTHLLSQSEERFRLLVSAVKDYAMFMLDTEGRIISWNTGAEKTKGYREEEILGKHISVFYTPEDQTKRKPQKLLQEALRTGRVEDEGWRVRKDGSLFWADVVITAIHEKGQFLGFAKVTRDMTERRAAQQSLLETEERFRLLVSAVKDYAIYFIDPDGTVVSWNEGAERAKGYSAEEIIGKSIAVFYTPEDLARNRPAELMRIAAEAGRVEDEGWRVRKDGTRFWADVVITAIRNAQGRLLGYAKVTRDLTERKETEERLKAKQVEINKLQKMESLGRLTGGIAHDFNNLVAGIQGCAEALEENIVDPESLKDAVEIKKACERAAGLVRQLMAFSRRQMAAPQPVQINTVIQNIAQLIRRSLPANIQFMFELDPKLPLILADPGQIEQILINLALNARDAMPKGGQLNIHTGTTWVDELSAIDGFHERPARAVTLSISDTGVGMTKDIQEKIFEPFFTTKEVGKGTGLGLSTVYGIVRQNRGGIAVYSSPGLGTTMKIFLPQPPQPIQPGEFPQLEAPAKDTRGENALILVVEDEPLVLRNTVRVLQAHGYAVLSAPNAEVGLDLFRETRGKLRLIVSDVVMPGRSGKELAAIIRQEDPGIGILFMSGYAPEIIATHGLLTNESDFLEKPFTSASLLQKVHEILHREKAK